MLCARTVDQSWISLQFGYRLDPLDGKKDFHLGIDFLGVLRSKVLSASLESL